MSERVRMTRLALLGRFLAGCMLLGAASAPAAAPVPAPAERWSVAWSEQRCTLFRRSERAPAALFVLRSVPGSRVWEVRLVSRAWSHGPLRDPRGVTVSLQPAGVVPSERSYVERTRAGEALVTYGLSSSLLDTIAASRSIRVVRDGVPILEFPLMEIAEAIAAARQCETRVLREWGVDPVAYEAIRVPPVADIAAVVTDADYPTAALVVGDSGMVVARMTVGTDGRVSECTPVVSSGHEILDARTCAIFQERLRFTPAIGADGAPTPAVVVTAMNWMLRR
jgi:TonB family protein